MNWRFVQRNPVSVFPPIFHKILISLEFNLLLLPLRINNVLVSQCACFLVSRREEVQYFYSFRPHNIFVYWLRTLYSSCRYSLIHLTSLTSESFISKASKCPSLSQYRVSIHLMDNPIELTMGWPHKSTPHFDRSVIFVVAKSIPNCNQICKYECMTICIVPLLRQLYNKHINERHYPLF